MVVVCRRNSRGAAARLASYAVLAMALLLPPSSAVAEALEWRPLSSIYTTTRTAIGWAMRDSGGAASLGDPAGARVAFVDLDERPGNAPSTQGAEVLVLPAAEACPSWGCGLEILTPDRGSYRRWAHMIVRNGMPELGPGFRHGMRDLIVDGRRYRFDGAHYRYTGALDAWSRLTEIDDTTRAWFEAEMERSGGWLENDDPARVWVAFVELDEVPSTRDRREIIVANENLDWCGTGGCSIDVFAFDGQGYTSIGGFLGGIIDLGNGFSHGRRDLMLGDVLVRFDGTRYVPSASRSQPAE